MPRLASKSQVSGMTAVVPFRNRADNRSKPDERRLILSHDKASCAQASPAYQPLQGSGHAGPQALRHERPGHT
ncbi:hypothetical protein SCOCK_60150 [Actinacidiphila cocklensis]|uniref:Uncharacterized protein n=1 Tax=Actinacidiphila cocklensis TaxID=887465 RepID=A0A9W4DXI6_9ACTN|nr:hypothetical protein SCOCK_60150 [Actinacidiphila cocklensis]